MLSWGLLHNHNDVARPHDIGLVAQDAGGEEGATREYRFHTKHSSTILARLDS